MPSNPNDKPRSARGDAASGRRSNARIQGATRDASAVVHSATVLPHPSLESRLSAFLSAAYSHVGDPVTLSSGDKVQTFDSGAEMAALIANANGTALAHLPTDDGRAAGVCLSFKKKSNADAYAGRVVPSFRVTGTDSRGLPTIFLVYLLVADDETDALVADMRAAWAGRKDRAVVDRFPITTDLDRLDADNLKIVKKGECFRVYGREDFEKRLFPVSLRMVGVPNPEHLQHEIQITRGAYTDALFWMCLAPLTIHSVVDQHFSEHAVDERKDGYGVSFASYYPVKDSAGREQIEKRSKWNEDLNGKKWMQNIPEGAEWVRRSRDTVQEIYAVGIDMDKGDDPHAVYEAIKKLGCLALVYSTHSNGKTLEEKPLKSLRAWAKRHKLEITANTISAEFIKEYLRSQKYRDHVVESVRNVRFEPGPGDGTVIFEIDPIAKMRAVIFLKAPFVIADFTGRDEAARVWQEINLGLAMTLGIVPDESAGDLNRMFFLPRHHPERPDCDLVLFAGDRLLDWRGVERVQAEKGSRGVASASATGDLYAAAAEAMSGSGGDTSRDTGDLNLPAWAGLLGKHFIVQNVIEGNAIDVRGDKPNGCEIECPFDEEHGNAGDSNDRACYVGYGDGDKGFFIKCQHDSCRHHDRLDFLCKMEENGLIDLAEELKNPDNYDLDAEKFAEIWERFIGGSKGEYPIYVDARGLVSINEGDPRFCIEKHEGRDWIHTVEWEEDDKGNPVRCVGSPCCPQFKLVSHADDRSRTSATVTIEFETRHNGWKQITFQKDAPYDRNAFLGMLARVSFPVESEAGTVAFFKLLDFPTDTLLVDRTGWHDGAMLHPSGAVLAARAASDNAEAPNKLRLRGDPPAGDWRGGTLAGWKAAFAPVFDNDARGREQFALGGMAGCAGIVAGFVGMAGFPILNLHGNTSRGKSTSLMLAASACGAPNQKGAYHSLRKTDNGMESILSARSGVTVAFDEGKTTNADTLDNIIWMMAHGVGKTRATVTGDSRVEREFCGFAMTANEVPLAQMMAAAKKSEPGGFHARVCDVDVSGVPELTGKDKDSFFTSLDGIKAHYGHAWEPVARHLQSGGVHHVASELDRLAKELAGPDADAFTTRSAKALALVWFSGMVMQELGLIPPCDLSRIVRWAWGTRAVESTLDPFTRATETLSSNVALRRGIDIYEWDEGTMTTVTTNDDGSKETVVKKPQRHREAAAFIYMSGLDELLLVPRDKLAELCGGHMSGGMIRDQMAAREMLVLSGKKDPKPRWSNLPDGQTVSHYRIKLSELAKLAAE